MRWVHEDNVIAERFTRNEIPGMFSKDLEIGNHESLIIEKENEIYDVYENMKISIISQLDREFTRAIMVDRSIKFMRFGIRNMITRTNLNMGIDFEFTFKVVKPDKLVENLFRSRHRL